MYKKYLLIFTSLISFSALSQSDYDTIINPKQLIKNNIYRFFLHYPMVSSGAQEPVEFSFNYERKLGKQFSLYSRAGLGFTISTFGPVENKYQFAFYFSASTELRYYFNLKHKLKKDKKVRNFSAWYFSGQQYVITNPFIKINNPEVDVLRGQTSMFLNIGFQTEYKSGAYLHVFFGHKVYRKRFEQREEDGQLANFHGGISIGYTLK